MQSQSLTLRGERIKVPGWEANVLVTLNAHWVEHGLRKMGVKQLQDLLQPLVKWLQDVRVDQSYTCGRPVDGAHLMPLLSAAIGSNSTSHDDFMASITAPLRDVLERTCEEASSWDMPEPEQGWDAAKAARLREQDVYFDVTEEGDAGRKYVLYIYKCALGVHV